MCTPCRSPSVLLAPLGRERLASKLISPEPLPEAPLGQPAARHPTPHLPQTLLTSDAPTCLAPPVEGPTPPPPEPDPLHSPAAGAVVSRSNWSSLKGPGEYSCQCRRPNLAALEAEAEAAPGGTRPRAQTWLVEPQCPTQEAQGVPIGGFNLSNELFGDR